MSIDHSRGSRFHSSAHAARSVQPEPTYRRATSRSLSRRREGLVTRVLAWAAALGPAKAALLSALLGIVLTLSSLWVGFAQDDYAILSVFKGSPGLEPLTQPVWNAFSFSEGDPARNQIRMETGILPWWGAPDWKINLWRPLSSLTHWVDYQLFGESPLPMHVHNLLLYGALCAAATLLYFRVTPAGWIAAIAGLLFAMDAAHGIPAGWIANRNAVLAGLFSVFALLAHHRWRAGTDAERPWHGWTRYGLLSTLCLALALLSAEAAVGLGAYYFAYAVTLDPVHSRRETPAPWRRGIDLRAHARAVSTLLPYLGVVVLWRLAYSAMGFGASESWLYVDPATAPIVFIQYVVVHTPLLLGTLAGLLDTQVWMPLSVPLKIAYSALIYATLFGIGWLIRGLWKRDAVLRFWVIGCVLSVIPVAGATLPADRNLMLSSIGSAAVIALLLSYVARGAFKGHGIRRKVATAFAVFFVITNVFLSVPQLIFNAYAIRALHVAFETIDATVSRADTVRDRTLVVLNTPMDIVGAGLPIIRSGMERPAPKHWWWLYAGDSDVAMTRVDESTLRLRPADGFLERPWTQLFRRPDATPFAAGFTVALSRMNVTVLDVSDDGRPLEAEFRFDAPLEDASYQWLAWNGAGYAPFELPAAGETATVPGVQPADIWRLAMAFLEPAREPAPGVSTD